MAAWTSDELNIIGSAEELDIASLRSDDTLRNPVTIWVVQVGADLYIRPVKGRNGWWRGTQSRKAGHIRSGGVEKDVNFGEADFSIHDQIDAEYRRKYSRYAANIVNSVLTSQAR